MTDQEKIKYYEAAHELIAKDEMFLNYDEEGNVIFLLLCNDTFGYGCSDCEQIKLEDCPKVLELLNNDGWPAVIKFIIEQREKNGDSFNRPLGQIKRMMNEYTDALEKARHELSKYKKIADL